MSTTPQIGRIPSDDDIAARASALFGFERLRSGQLAAIRAVLDGTDAIVVMATGSGKSAIYQLAGQFLPGPILVVSPLIALQKDQVAAIEEHVGDEAARLDASVSARVRERRLEDLASRTLRYLFLAPEQLRRADTLEALREVGISLIVIDEAHCISEWGHDFRPDYLRLGALVSALEHPTVLALTASASEPTRADIAKRLRMTDPVEIVSGFDRPNIALSVRRLHEAHRQRAALIDYVHESSGSGIVYVATRAEAEDLADALGEDAAAYHAGLGRAERDAIQEGFMDGAIRVIAATTAFGMGIDKPDVRFVAHLEPSDSLDSYYQEIGRAGRDGEPAEAVLFYRPEDIGRRRFFAAGGVDPETVISIARTVSEATTIDATDLQENLDLSASKVATALSQLEDAGVLSVELDGTVHAEEEHASTAERVAASAARSEADRQAFDQSRLEMMRRYAETHDCRRALLVSYFGEPYEAPCNNCDCCTQPSGTEPAPEPAVNWDAGQHVEHDEWGRGVIQRADGDQLQVLFDNVGYKTLATAIVDERGLLRSSMPDR